MLANQNENIVQAQSEEGQADVQSGETSRGGQDQSGEGSPQPSQAADNQQTPQGLPSRLSEERRVKLAALLAGTSGFDPKLPSFSAMPKGVTGYEGKKEEPLIGPDGGIVGRGIKSVGDAYQEYIDGQRDTIMNTMNHELNKTFTPQLIDGVNTWAHNMLTMTTGIDTGFKSEFPINKVLSPSSWFNTGSGTPPVMGFQSRVPPLMAPLVGAARWMGDDPIKPSEVANYGRAATLLGLSSTSSPANQAAQKVLDGVNKGWDSGNATFEVVSPNK